MVFLGSVSWPGTPAPPVPGVSVPPELRLVQACVEKSRGNVMISPFSLYEVLRYMLPGAAGETGKQMEAVLPGNGTTGKEWSFLSDGEKHGQPDQEPSEPTGNQWPGGACPSQRRVYEGVLG